MAKEKAPEDRKRSIEDSRVAVRRSRRLNSLDLLEFNKTTVEHVNFVGVENVEEENTVLLGKQIAEGNLVDNGNEETIEQQTVPNNLKNEKYLDKEEAECIMKSTNDLSPKNIKQARKKKGSSAGLKYKRLYIESQKMIESMINKHYKMVNRLKYAKGKIDAYEKMIVLLRGDKDAEGMSSKSTDLKVDSAAAVDDDPSTCPKQKRASKKE